MAGSSRRYTLAAFAVPFLFLAMSGLARANTIIVNTLEGGSHYGLCTLQDAVTAAETQAPVHGCAAAAATTTRFNSSSPALSISAIRW